MAREFIKQLNLEFLVCNNCNHKWKQRGEEAPLICPKCKSARWDKEPKKKVKKSQK